MKILLIIFTSDNGPWFSFGNHAGSTGGLREAKKLPRLREDNVFLCIMCWKGVIPRGTVYNQLASNDYMICVEIREKRYDVKDQYPEVVRLLQSIAEEARLDLGDDLTGQIGLNRQGSRLHKIIIYEKYY